MHEQDTRIDALARAFVNAAAALGEAMADQLATTAPALSSQVNAAMVSGERMLLALELSATAPAIRMMTIDDYQQTKVVMSISGKVTECH